MGTKANPSTFDCYAEAADDEPMFVLLARDPVAPYLIQIWRCLRARNPDTCNICINYAEDAIKAAMESGKPFLPLSAPKSVEADECAKAMIKWMALDRPAKKDV